MDADELPATVADDDVGLSVERAWQAWEVRQALDALGDGEREVVRLSHLEGLSLPETAERLGIPVGTAKVPLAPGVSPVGRGAAPPAVRAGPGRRLPACSTADPADGRRLARQSDGPGGALLAFWSADPVREADWLTRTGGRRRRGGLAGSAGRLVAKAVEGAAARAQESASSARGRPTTLELSSSTERTSTPPAPCSADQAPALSSGSPVPTYQAMSASEIVAIVTRVVTTRCRGPAGGPHRHAGVDLVGPVRQEQEHAPGIGGVGRLAQDVTGERERWCRPPPRRPQASRELPPPSRGRGARRSPAGLRRALASRRCRARWRRTAARSSPAAVGGGRSGGEDQAWADLAGIDSRSRPLGPFLPAPGRSAFLPLPAARACAFPLPVAQPYLPLPAARACRSRRWALSFPAPGRSGHFCASACRSSTRHQGVSLRGRGDASSGSSSEPVEATGRGPFVWPRWMRWPPGTSPRSGSSPSRRWSRSSARVLDDGVPHRTADPGVAGEVPAGVLAERLHAGHLAAPVDQAPGVVPHDRGDLPEARRRLHGSAGEGVDEVAEQPRAAPGSRGRRPRRRSRSAASMASASWASQMSPLPSTGMVRTARLEGGDGVPVGRAAVELLGGAGVEGDGGHALLLGDPTRLEVGEDRVVDAHAELDRHRHPTSAAATAERTMCAEQAAAHRQGRATALARHLGHRTAEVHVDVVDPDLVRRGSARPRPACADRCRRAARSRALSEPSNRSMARVRGLRSTSARAVIISDT